MIVGLVVYWVIEQVLPGLWPIIETGDEAEIEKYIRDQGSLGGIIVLAVLQMLQVISVICPGAPIQIAAGIVEGPLVGFLVCYFSYVAINMLIFVLARKLDNKTGAFFSTDEVKESKFKFITEAKHPEIMVAVGCMMPFLPNGIIPHVAARTKQITTKNFFYSVLIGSPLPILALCLIGPRLLRCNFLLAALMLVGLVGITVLLFVFRDQISRIVYKKGV